MKREARYLYLALLKKSYKILNLHKMIGFYEEYNNLRGRIMSSAEAPFTLRGLMSLKMPKYLKWVKKYLV